MRLVSCDMSLGFRKGIRECLPNVRRIVDKFHVARHANEAVDKAGKTEGRSNPLLKRTKYLWLRNEESLAELQLETKRNLTRQRLRTGRACRMREVPQDVYADSVLLQCLFDRFGSVFPQCGLMVFPGVVIVSR